MKTAIKLFGLTGFLGHPSDLNCLSALSLLDFFSPASQERDFSLPILATHAIKSLWLHKPTEPYALVGYSFGARVLLHALEALNELRPAPCFCIILSGSFGNDFSSEQERKNRFQSDQRWAERFLNLPWDELMHLWNQQPIFKKSTPVLREEKDFYRAYLAQALIQGSVSIQMDCSFILKKTPIPIYWLAGSYDDKFKAIAYKAQQLNPKKIKALTIPQAGHRLLWDQPALLPNICGKIIQSHQSHQSGGCYVGKHKII